ncbi:hypothetical protein ACRAWF_34970 [Streptomyces sp. L7]
MSTLFQAANRTSQVGELAVDAFQTGAEVLGSSHQFGGWSLVRGVRRRGARTVSQPRARHPLRPRPRPGPGPRSARAAPAAHGALQLTGCAAEALHAVPGR